MQFSTLALVAFASGLASAADVGASGIIDTKDGGLGGTITVTNDTTLTISQYTLKSASAPALYWWGSKTSDLPKGFRINNERVSAAATTDSITIPLDAGYMAGDFAYVGLWCEKLNANFGQAQLVAKDGSSSSGTPTSSGAAASSSSKTGAAPAMGAGKVAAVAAANVLGIAAFLV
ncbi:DM13 domain protein [Akanthomyces lecanii RCEF 1005]|uniref:DM13 domain protein n=1 Tax=Akanthomyces lecanii RCEF 1005 TaxID=1081108 RepID=A0A168FGC1_CORDF|nr:DM13 domain protein [Akanthomyces lecanii RCEF 1005]